MRVKSMKVPGVLGALLTLLSPKGGLHMRRLIVALLTPADLLAIRQVGADSARRPAWPMADSERRLTSNLQFVSTALLAAGLMLVHRTTNAQVVTTLAGSGARDADLRRTAPDREVMTVRPRRPYVMSVVGVSNDASGNLYVADGGDEVK